MYSQYPNSNHNFNSSHRNSHDIHYQEFIGLWQVSTSDCETRTGKLSAIIRIQLTGVVHKHLRQY